MFSNSPSEIGELPYFQIKIDLTNSIPVNDLYRCDQRKLYLKVKYNINELMKKNESTGLIQHTSVLSYALGKGSELMSLYRLPQAE